MATCIGYRGAGLQARAQSRPHARPSAAPIMQRSLAANRDTWFCVPASSHPTHRPDPPGGPRTSGESVPTRPRGAFCPLALDLQPCQRTDVSSSSITYPHTCDLSKEDRPPRTGQKRTPEMEGGGGPRGEVGVWVGSGERVGRPRTGSEAVM
jgi:hypothetical protein